MLCAVSNIPVCRVCVVFVWPFVWGLAAPSLTTFLCFPPSRLRAALFPTVFHRIFANGESSLCPTWGSVCAPSAPLCGCPVHAVVGAIPVPLPPCLIMPAWLLPYQPSTCLPLHNLLVSCGFAWPATYILESYSLSSSGWFPKPYCAPRLCDL